jgi:hypothetical protein
VQNNVESHRSLKTLPDLTKRGHVPRGTRRHPTHCRVRCLPSSVFSQVSTCECARPRPAVEGGRKAGEKSTYWNDFSYCHGLVNGRISVPPPALAQRRDQSCLVNVRVFPTDVRKVGGILVALGQRGGEHLFDIFDSRYHLLSTSVWNQVGYSVPSILKRLVDAAHCIFQQCLPHPGFV